MKLLASRDELPPPPHPPAPAPAPSPAGMPGLPGGGPRQADGASLQGLHVEAGLRQSPGLQRPPGILRGLQAPVWQNGRAVWDLW